MADTTLDLPVLGMTCAACVRRVERAALAVPGVARAEVNLPLSRARIVLDPAVASAASAAAAIRAAGYEVPADALDAAPSGAERMAAIERAHADETAGLRRDAALAIAGAVPLLALAMTHGAIVPADSAAGVIAQLLLGTLVVLGPGMRYMRAGLRAARHRAPDMSTLIALGAGAAWLSSVIAAIGWLTGPRHHAPELYFEAGAAIVAFVMVGKLLEARARSRLADAVRGLVSLAPVTARRRAGGAGDAGDAGGADGVAEVDAAALAPGDVIEVRPGERLAADGTVIEGHSAVDESMLTGESLPVDKAEGAPVYAGTLNHHGALAVRVARAGAATALARIARAVEDAQGQKPEVARLADRVAMYFVPAVLAIAAVTLAAWLLAGAGAAAAIESMVAVLVIACPCALGLATPAAVAVGSARGAELGILYRSGAALELASAIDVVCLDKTGTLTAGQPALVGAELPAEALRLVASAEQRSEHPIARAIVLGARARGAILSAPAEVTATPGAGLSAVVDGHRVLAGTRAHLLLAGVEVPAEVPGSYPGATLSHVAIDGAYAGVLAVADPPAPGAREAIAALRALGIEPRMLSGDREDAARAVAREVGIERVHAGVRPTEKAALVAEARRSAAGGAGGGGGRGDRARRVAMVGDGINDAPALAAADLGVALGSGTEIAAAAADVTLLRGGIASLPVAFELARATLGTIRRNLAAAFVYNVLCIPIAAGVLAPLTGWRLSPVLASAAMSLSSVSVLLSSLRLRSFRPSGLK